MIKFSWKSINDKFGWNAFNVLSYFYLKQNIKQPAFLLDKIPKVVKKAAAFPYQKGPCFIINIDGALKEATSGNDLYIYLELASMRNVFDYHMRGVRHLPLALVPEYLVGLLEANPLLKIENDKVYFKYEQE